MASFRTQVLVIWGVATVVVSAQLPGKWRDCLKDHHLIEPSSAIMSPETWRLKRHGAAGLITLLTQSVDQEMLEQSPALQVIANYAVGYDNIDVDAATAAGVAVCNTPDVLTDATAELALALTMSAQRQLPRAEVVLRNGQWSGWEPQGFLGRQLAGANVGIVGLGRIGSAYARIVSALGAVVKYWAPRERKDTQFERTESLDMLLSWADVVSMHCPLTPNTYHLIGEKELAIMKNTAVLVNTARGPCVDELALAKALVNGSIGGAGLDVFEHEPKVATELLAAPNAVLLPHVGSATYTARSAMAELCASAVAAVLDGGVPGNIVNPEVLAS